MHPWRAYPLQGLHPQGRGHQVQEGPEGRRSSHLQGTARKSGFGYFAGYNFGELLNWKRMEPMSEKIRMVAYPVGYHPDPNLEKKNPDPILKLHPDSGSSYFFHIFWKLLL